jgi:thiosulfate/3-mercaptopyruvate sulfurtransferase
MVKKILIATIVLLILSMIVSQGFACVGTMFFKPYRRNVPSIVSTNWLKANLHRKNLVVLDVRTPELYSAGHIPGAINVPEAEWYVNDPFTVPVETPWMELPPVGELFSIIGNAGITSHSLVVVLGSTSGSIDPTLPLALYGTAGITRVAITLLYAGVTNVAILDGGHDKWAADEYPTESGTVTPTPVTYCGRVKRGMLASMQYVNFKIGKSIIVDGRDPEVYSCLVLEPWADYVGHIPTARSLPVPSLWDIKTDDGVSAIYVTYKDVGTLKKMASDVVGKAKGREIIVYCGVGGYGSTLYFVLSKVLGYNHVKFYDGSAQEWTQSGMPVEC